MTAQILLAQYLAGEHSIGILCNIQKTVTAALRVRIAVQLIYISAGLHTEVADGLKGDILCQYADIENTGVLNHLAGQIPFLQGNDQLVRGVCYLKTGVTDTAIVDFLPGGEYKQSVGQMIQRRRVLRR